jgi:ComF family protein
MFRPFRELAAGLLDLLLPPICSACSRSTEGEALCPACDVRSEGLLPDQPAPKPLASWTAAVPHEDTARDWIARFKYPKRGLAGIDPAADAVARYWIQRAAAAVPGDPPDALVPVPLHTKRLRERGFNQATILARDAAWAVGSVCRPMMLERVRDTATQTDLSRQERRRNVAGAFAARSAVPERVWLVDDVATTGATLVSAARTLRRAGAREVRAVTLAWRPFLG